LKTDEVDEEFQTEVGNGEVGNEVGNALEDKLTILIISTGAKIYLIT
jgi:hypothetical protein